MLSYLLEVTLCWAGFYGLYALLLSKTTFFGANRLYLFGTLLLGLIIPLAPLPEWSPEPGVVGQYLEPLKVGVQQVEYKAGTMPARPGLTWRGLILGLYGLGVAFFLIRLLVGLARLLALYREGEKEDCPGFRIIRTPRPHLPFSFFNLLFLSRELDLDEEEWRTVMQHEEAHIRGLHSLDVLVTEFLCALFWCVPPVYFYRRSLRQTHEYLADQAALGAMRVRRYGRLLLRQSQTDLQMAFANNLVQSSLKKRIIMMTRHRSSRPALLRYALLLPLMVLFLLAFANRSLIGQTLLEIRKPDGSVEKFQVNPDNIPDHLIDPESIASIDVRKGQDQDLIVVRLKEITESSSEAPSGVRVRKQPVEAESIKAKVRALASPRSDKAESKGSLEMSNPVIRVHYPDGSVHTGEKGDGTLEDLDPNRIANMNVTKPADGSRPRIDVYVKENSIGESDKTKQSPMAAVGQMPRFPGCEASDLGAKAREKCAAQKMIGFLRSELRYPEGARKQEVEGMVVVEFTVGRDGAVRSPKVIQSLSPDCDAEALRVVLAMPKWVPGQKEGEPVAVTMKLPFKFALPAKDKELPAVQSSVLDLAEFSIAPNPSSGNVRVKFSAEAMPTRLVISDMQGRALLTRDLEDFDGYYDQRLDLDPFAAGPLVLVISQGDKVFSRRIVLEE